MTYADGYRLGISKIALTGFIRRCKGIDVQQWLESKRDHRLRLSKGPISITRVCRARILETFFLRVFPDADQESVAVLARETSIHTVRL